VSIASAWEISIKVGLHKLEIDAPLSELLGTRLHNIGVDLLPLTIADLIAFSELPFPDPKHRDPFDRMIVTQAIQRNLTLVTADSRLRAYPVQVLDWDEPTA